MQRSPQMTQTWVAEKIESTLLISTFRLLLRIHEMSMTQYATGNPGLAKPRSQVANTPQKFLLVPTFVGYLKTNIGI